LVEDLSTKVHFMSLNIKSAEAHRLAREIAQLRGVSLTHAVTEALQEKLDREKHRRRGKPLSTELLEIGERCAAHIKGPVKSSDHAVLLYDKKGLPR
jgi:antitoxin VapB